MASLGARSGGMIVCAALMWGCPAEGDGETQVIDPDVGPIKDARIAMEWDSDTPTGPPRDVGPARDAEIEVCLSEGGELVERFVSEPVPGLEGLRADLDLGEDGTPDLLVTLVEANGLRLRALDGRTADPIGEVALPGAASAEFMAGLTPLPDLLTPITVGGEGIYYVLETRTDGVVGIRVLAGSDLSSQRFIELPNGAFRVHVMGQAERWYVLVDDTLGNCTIRTLVDDAVLESLEGCRLRPAWDANNDGVTDILRAGRSGLTLLDGGSLEVIAHVPDQATNLGFVPGEGASDLRGMGPEVVSVANDGRALLLQFRGHVELDARGDPLSLGGTYLSTEFRATSQGLRLLATEERGLTEIDVVEFGRSLRTRATIGGYRNLEWGGVYDADGDGELEFRVLGGPEEDLTNSELQFINPRNGESAFTIQAERSARYHDVWLRRDGVNVAADLDGCEGLERVAVRAGRADVEGVRPTRTFIFGAEDRRRQIGEDQEGRVHTYAIQDLDGDGVSELLEIRSEDSGSARLRVLSAAQRE